MPKSEETRDKVFRPTIDPTIYEFYEKYLEENPEMGNSVSEFIRYVLRRDIEKRKRELKE